MAFENRGEGGLTVIRINLGALGLGGVRFAVSPLDPAKDLLFALGRTPNALSAQWRARTTKALSQGRLGLLAVVAGGGPRGYAPDFLRPEPQGFQTSLDAALHQVATTPPEQIRYELTPTIRDRRRTLPELRHVSRQLGVPA